MRGSMAYLDAQEVQDYISVCSLNRGEGSASAGSSAAHIWQHKVKSACAQAIQHNQQPVVY